MFFLIPFIIGAATALGVVVLVCLNWDRIVDWFKGRRALKQSDKDNIAFTLQQKLSNGKHKTVEGIFNKGSNKLLDGTVYESETIDEQLAEYHRNDELVVYN
jgi:hypothetical protein